MNKPIYEFEIYSEGYAATGESAGAFFVGTAHGTDFLDACRNYILRTGRGEISKDASGKPYASDWGCRWFPTLSEAQRSFGG